MSDGRPSDAMQPNSKRRAGGDQLTKDDISDGDDDEGVDPGSWKPVDPEIAKRRKVKVRRAGGPAEPALVPEEPVSSGPPAAAAANPFAGIALAAPAAATANPFAGFNLMAPAGDQAKAANGDVDKADMTGGVAAASEDKATAKPAGTPAASGIGFGSTVASGGSAWAALASSSTPTSGFGGFAAAAAAGATPGSGSTAGGFGGGGFGGFGGTGGFAAGGAAAAAAAAAGGGAGNGADAPGGAATPLFGSSLKSSGFSFGTGSFPAPKATPPGASSGGADGDGGGEGGDGEGGNVEVFGESTAEFRPVVEMPDATKVVTGEEDESVRFTAPSTLFEFDGATNKWRERGKGEFRLNTDKTGQARMVMRQAGNYRLLLNASVYPGMAVQKMAGDVGVSFACFNAAAAAEAAAATPEKKDEASAAGATLATWALKIKSREQVNRLHEELTSLNAAKGAEVAATGAATGEQAV
ncbi:hypothetical protein FOA52_013731 [Chlamydomonas sp. UWO 241]|nr:hypothetical protein FOA52_013731 [Chlamydomonas sp. UWO 241]